MQYLVPTEFEVDEFIHARWSPRAFSDKAIPSDALRSLFEAAPWEATAAFAIGYPGDPHSFPEPYRSKETAPRTHKPLHEFVMAGHWGQAAPFLK
ncbi:MAG TPA: hypothetical protein VLX32_08180 [Candidatus Acidoferrum sp.]|nr:hypothetical protein [Candidatus Acidoferrum sp.]